MSADVISNNLIRGGLEAQRLDRKGDWCGASNHALPLSIYGRFGTRNYLAFTSRKMCLCSVIYCKNAIFNQEIAKIPSFHTGLRTGFVGIGTDNLVANQTLSIEREW